MSWRAEGELTCRRYDDFSTVGMSADLFLNSYSLSELTQDWVQDSLRERHPRSHRGPKPGSVMDRLNHLDGFIGWLWRFILRALREGESYVIITLTGTHAVPTLY